MVRPGNTVGLTAWVPDGLFAELFGIGRSFWLQAPDVARPEQWGDEATVRERLAGLAAHVECERRTLTWEAESPAALEAELSEHTPSYAAAREGLPAEHYEELRRLTLDLIERHNRASGGGVRLEAEYLVTVARKRG